MIYNRLSFDYGLPGTLIYLPRLAKGELQYGTLTVRDMVWSAPNPSRLAVCRIAYTDLVILAGHYEPICAHHTGLHAYRYVLCEEILGLS